MNFSIKIYLIAGAIALVLGAVFIGYIIFGGGASSTSNKISIKVDKEEIQLNDFLTGAKKLGDTVYLAEDPSYSIVYPTGQGQFFITLMEYNKKDLERVRNVAEQQLVSKLSVSKEQACKLSVHVVVPDTYNQRYSSGDYGLSFCPNGKEFELEQLQESLIPEEEITLPAVDGQGFR